MLHVDLGPVAASMGWGDDDAPAYHSALAQVLAITGRAIADVDSLAGDALLHFRALLRAEVWRIISSHLALDVDYSADGASFKRSQAQATAERMRTQALADAAQYGEVAEYMASTVAITHTDPYLVDYDG